MKPDSFRWLPVVLASTAIAISCLSWWEAHRNRIISEEINRPIISVGKIEASSGAESGTGNIRVWFRVGLKNDGKGTAIVDRATVEPFLTYEIVGECQPGHLAARSAPQSFEVLPGFEKGVFCVITLPPKCGKSSTLHFELPMLVTYTDSGSGRQYFQSLSGFSDLPMMDSRVTPSLVASG